MSGYRLPLGLLLGDYDVHHSLLKQVISHQLILRSHQDETSSLLEVCDRQYFRILSRDLAYVISLFYCALLSVFWTLAVAQSMTWMFPLLSPTVREFSDYRSDENGLSLPEERT